MPRVCVCVCVGGGGSLVINRVGYCDLLIINRVRGLAAGMAHPTQTWVEHSPLPLPGQDKTESIDPDYMTNSDRYD